MSFLVVDKDLGTKLLGVREKIELRDERGFFLGYFEPAATKEDYEWAKAQITDEEIERARQEPGLYTTQEVLDYLRTL